MIHALGDIHGDTLFLEHVINSVEKGDTLVLLGDAGLNFTGKKGEKFHKQEMSAAAVANNVDILVVRGNHDKRPSNIPSYKLIDYKGDQVWYEDDCPNLYFAKDGGYYNIEGFDVFTIGGAYSIDKFYRLANRWTWFSDEQLSEEERAHIWNNLREDFNYDLVFTHTCPFDYRPVKDFLNYKIEEDYTMELFLQKIETKLRNKIGKWMCGHFHHNRILCDHLQVVGINQVQSIWKDENNKMQLEPDGAREIYGNC